MFTVYILRGPKNHLYIGCTSDFGKRLIRHKNGDGAEFTFRNKAFVLAYQEEFRHKNGDGAEFTFRNKAFVLAYQEEYSTLKETRNRETQIKKWRREKKENLIKFGKAILK